MSSKRPRGSPTGETPVQLQKRTSHLRDQRCNSASTSLSRRNLNREYYGGPEVYVFAIQITLVVMTIRTNFRRFEST